MKQNRTRDLTEGSIIKNLMIFALPLIGMSLLQTVYSIADLLIAGRAIGSVGLSAINNASQITVMVGKIATGLTIGGNILIGQCFGAKDEQGRKDASKTTFALSNVVGIAFVAFGLLAGRPLLILMDTPTLVEACVYLQICSIGFFFLWGYNGLSAMMRAVGDSSSPFQIIMITSVVNIVLDIIMMAILHMGVAGAAWATTISQALCYLIALWKVLKSPDIYGFDLRGIGFVKGITGKILKLGIPTALQMTIGSITWLVVAYYINQYGIDVSAGNGISIKIKDISQIILSALSTGATTMIAQNLGAGLFDRAKKTMQDAMKISVLIAAVMIVAIEILAPLLVGFFTTEPAVAQAAIWNLRIEIIGQLFYAMFFIYHALMTGAGHTWMVMFSSFVNCILVRIVLAGILSYYMGANGVYLGCMIAPFASVPIGMVYVRRGRWRRATV